MNKIRHDFDFHPHDDDPDFVHLHLRLPIETVTCIHAAITVFAHEPSLEHFSVNAIMWALSSLKEESAAMMLGLDESEHTDNF
jgi:hypothetical protein